MSSQGSANVAISSLSNSAQISDVFVEIHINYILDGLSSVADIGNLSVSCGANVDIVGIDNIVSLGDVKAFEYFKVYKWNVDIKQGNKLKTSYKEIELRKKERNIKWLLDNLDTLR